MKQAKQHKGAHGHPACGNCARTVRTRHDAAKVACTVHLKVMSSEHADFCEDYLAHGAQADAAPVETSAPHETDSSSPENHVDRT